MVVGSFCVTRSKSDGGIDVDNNSSSDGLLKKYIFLIHLNDLELQT